MRRTLTPISGLISLWVILVSLSLWYRGFLNLPEHIAILSDHVREALVARNCLEGRGWTTPILPLYSLNLYREMGLLDKGPPWPNSERFPLPTLITASLMFVFGKSGIVSVLFYNLLFHFLALLAVYWLTLKTFKDKTTAFLAGLLFITNPDVSNGLADGKTGPDLFIAIMGLATLLSWLRKPSLGRCVLASMVCGLAFLMRYNLGAIFFVTSLLTFAVVQADSRFPYINRKIVFYATIYTVVFLAFMTPLLVYNERTFHKLFFSLNAQLQFSNVTRLVSFTDPWWKLEGPVRDLSALKAFLSFPGVFLRRIVFCLYTGTVGFILLSSQSYLWPFFGYQVYEDLKNNEKKFDIQTHTVVLLGAIAFLDFCGTQLMTAPFSGINGNTYVLWSYLPILMGGAAGAVRWWRSSGREWANRLIRRLDSLLFLKSIQGVATFIIGLTLLWDAAYYIGHRLRLALGSAYGSFVVCAYLVVLLSVCVFCAILYFRKPFVGWICLILFFILPVSLKYLSQPYVAINDPNVLDFPQAFTDIRETIGPHEIVVTTSQSVFSWFADRPSLGIPEYPELMYSLLDQYRLPVRAVFLYKTKTFVDAAVQMSNWNYGFSGYSRIAEHFYPIRGFVLKKVYWPDYPEEGPALLYLHDDSVPLSSLLDTQEIHFGDPRDAIHLIYGWSQVDSEGNHKVAFVFKNANRKVSLSGNRAEFTSKPATEGEFTFMLRPPFPKDMRLTFKSPIAQRMDVYLNHDLTYYQSVHEVSRHRIALNLPLPREQWMTLTIPLPQGMLRDGLNKIGLSFPDCNSSDLAIKGKSLLKIPGYLFKENATDRDVVIRGDHLHQFELGEPSSPSGDSTESSVLFSFLGTGKKAVSFVCAAVEKASFEH